MTGRKNNNKTFYTKLYILGNFKNNKSHMRRLENSQSDRKKIQ